MVINQLEKSNYNQNLVWINKIQKRFLCIQDIRDEVRNTQPFGWGALVTRQSRYPVGGGGLRGDEKYTGKKYAQRKIAHTKKKGKT